MYIHNTCRCGDSCVANSASLDNPGYRDIAACMLAKALHHIHSVSSNSIIILVLSVLLLSHMHSAQGTKSKKLVKKNIQHYNFCACYFVIIFLLFIIFSSTPCIALVY